MSNRAERRQKHRGGLVSTGAFRNDGIVPGQMYSFGSTATVPDFQPVLMVANYEPLPDGKFMVVVCDRDLTDGLESVAANLADGLDAAAEMIVKLANRFGRPVLTMHTLNFDKAAFDAEATRLGIKPPDMLEPVWPRSA